MLETTRLILVPLTHDQLLLFKNDPEALARSLDLNYIARENDPAVLPDLEEATEFWINNTKAHPEYYHWFTTWEIIVKEQRLAIGGIGFAGFPDEQGKSIIGYGLDVRFHGKGYASEAVEALIRWGFQHDALKQIIADTPLFNFPSHRVLEKNNFSESSRDETLIHWKLDR